MNSLSNFSNALLAASNNAKRSGPREPLDILHLVEVLSAFASSIYDEIDDNLPMQPTKFFGTNWFEALHPVYNQLEQHVGSMSIQAMDQANRLFLPEHVLALLFALRFVYECDLERELALATLADDNPAAAILFHVDRKILALGDSFFNAVKGKNRLVFAGSGPFPTTAMAISRVLNCNIVCVDPDTAANTLARQFIAAANMSQSIEIVDARLEANELLDQSDAIVCAFLFGVSAIPNSAFRKTDIVRQVVNKIKPGVRLIMRTPPLARGNIIYPGIEKSAFPDCRLSIQGAGSKSDPITYDSTFATLQKNDAI